MIDQFYRAFEDAHRGSRDSVTARLAAYQPVLEALRIEHSQPLAIDIGCGRGEWLAYLNENGIQAEGVDLDDGMLQACRDHGLQVRLMDGLKALQDLPDDSMSLVSMFHLVEHVEFDTLLKLFEQALRVLKPGGLLLAETPNPENLVVGTSSFYLDPTHNKPLPPPLLKFAAQYTGFKNTHVLRLNHMNGLAEEERLRLVHVLFHSSPDYAVLAMKQEMRNTQAASLLEQAVSELQGFTLEYLSETMSAQQARRVGLCEWDIKQLIGQLADARAEIAQLRAQLDQPAATSFLGRLSARLGQLLNGTKHVKRPCHVFVDVSNICTHDLNTGIERVVKAYLNELLIQPGLVVVPVKLVHTETGWQYHTCAEYLKQAALPPLPDFNNGDVFWGLDYFPHGVHLAEAAGLFDHLRGVGVKLIFQVYDLLPVTHPQFFPPGAGDTHERWIESLSRCADELVCISGEVVKSVRHWAAQRSIKLRPKLHAVHLGADLASVRQSAACDLPAGLGSEFVLSVGTLEPRKGHDQALDAFERLWENGSDLNYVIVGREGWKGVATEHRAYIASLCERLENHPLLNKKLWWLKSAEDDLLLGLYQQAMGVLVPSREEGYGLPLIEAANYGAPLLVRQLPVFQEVAGSHAEYFEGNEAAELAIAIEKWQDKLRNNQAVGSAGMPRMSWSDSLSSVLDCCGLAKRT